MTLQPISKKLRQFECCLIIAFITVAPSHCEMVDMKIVEEPSSFGSPGAYGYPGNSEPTLKLRLQPANFSGPPHFRRLIGRCFEDVISGYKYKFCPFQNVTQHEQGANWNPYNGVLGVWEDWEIHNNTFVSMVMKDGDDCGSIYRSVRITFHCGVHSKIINASEPETCSYHLRFQTPLVCHPDSMLVYPTLTPDLRDQWDIVEGEFVRGELTEQGYRKRLDVIFEAAGYLMDKKIRASLLAKSEKEKPEAAEIYDFDTLYTCREEMKSLRERIKALESELSTCQNSSDHPGDFVLPADNS